MKRFAIALSCAVVALSLRAQDTSTAEAKAKEAETVRALTDPRLESTILGSLDGLEFEATADEKKVSAVIASGETWHLKFSGPLSKSSDKSTVLTRHGLAGASTLEFGLKHQVTDWKAEPDFAALAKLCGPDGCTNFDDVPDEDLAKAIKLSGYKSFLGGTFEYGRTKFDYRDTDTLEPKDQTHSQYSATIAYAVLPRRVGFLFGSIGYRYERSYEEQDEKNICTPLEKGNGTECKTLPDGAPKRDTSSAVELEGRFYRGTKMAFSPVISYRFNGKGLAVEVPFYFLQGKEGLNGGIVFGWSKEKDEFTAALFVGALKQLFE